MLKRNCVVKYVDTFGIEHAVKVEAESLFDAAIRGLLWLDSNLGAKIWDGTSITVEVCAEPTTYAAVVQNLKHWMKSEDWHPQEEIHPRRLRVTSRSATGIRK